MTVRPEEEWLSSWANINDIMSLLVARPWAWLVDMTFNQQLLKAEFPPPEKTGGHEIRTIRMLHPCLNLYLYLIVSMCIYSVALK